MTLALCQKYLTSFHIISLKECMRIEEPTTNHHLALIIAKMLDQKIKYNCTIFPKIQRIINLTPPIVISQFIHTFTFLNAQMTKTSRKTLYVKTWLYIKEDCLGGGGKLKFPNLLLFNCLNVHIFKSLKVNLIYICIEFWYIYLFEFLILIEAIHGGWWRIHNIFTCLNILGKQPFGIKTIIETT